MGARNVFFSTENFSVRYRLQLSLSMATFHGYFRQHCWDSVWWWCQKNACCRQFPAERLLVERHLHRRFHRCLRYSPKQYSPAVGQPFLWSHDATLVCRKMRKASPQNLENSSNVCGQTGIGPQFTLLPLSRCVHNCDHVLNALLPRQYFK